MSRIVRWNTPFTDAFYPSVVVLSIPSPRGIKLQAIVAPDGIGEYPKHLVHFGDVIAFTCMEEACCPKRDFDSAIFEAKNLCAYQYLDSPWLKSYEACFDPESQSKFSHYILFGGDNNVEVITEYQPAFELVVQKKNLSIEYKI